MALYRQKKIQAFRVTGVETKRTGTGTGTVTAALDDGRHVIANDAFRSGQFVQIGDYYFPRLRFSEGKIRELWDFETPEGFKSMYESVES
jgi:hypothetical protein